MQSAERWYNKKIKNNFFTMNAFIIWLSSFALAGVIISPFFGLRFLKKKSVWKYLIASTVTTLIIFGWFIYFGYDLTSDWAAKIDADLYYLFYDILDITLYLGFVFFLFYPFVFSKIIYGKISWKNFFISLLLSVLIFFIYVYVFVYILLPKAFSELHNYF
jgi:hypothetical protein